MLSFDGVMLIVVDNLTNALLYSSSFWRFPANGLYLISGQAILFTVALFPNGRFVPRWSFWVTLVYPTCVVCYLLFLRPLRIPGWAVFNNPVNAVIWFGSWTVLTLAQLYRYFRVSNAVERKQTKWVAFGFFAYLVGVVEETMQPAHVSLWLSKETRRSKSHTDV